MKDWFKNWDAIRIIRLLAGIGFGIYAVVSKDYLFLLLAGMFIMQSMLNISCCGAGGCSSSSSKKQEEIYKGQIKKYKG